MKEGETEVGLTDFETYINSYLVHLLRPGISPLRAEPWHFASAARTRSLSFLKDDTIVVLKAAMHQYMQSRVNN